MLTQRALTNQRVSSVGRRVRQGWWSSLPVPVGNIISAVTVTADTTAHTKGSWAELIASTSEDVDTLCVNVTGISSSTADTATLLDIGIGAAASEVAVISNVAVGSAASNSGSGIWFTVPLFIRKGSRVSARIQSVVTGGKTASVQVLLAKSGSMVPSRAPTSSVTFGTSTSTSVGTAVSATTYTQITASTTQPLSAVVVVPSASSTNTGAVSPYYQFTFAIGAAGAEVDVGFVTWNSSTTEQAYVVSLGLLNIFPVDIPEGVRLSVKAGAANNGSYDVSLIGIPRIA